MSILHGVTRNETKSCARSIWFRGILATTSVPTVKANIARFMMYEVGTRPKIKPVTTAAQLPDNASDVLRSSSKRCLVWYDFHEEP